jgi:hypothetical protein
MIMTSKRFYLGKERPQHLWVLSLSDIAIDCRIEVSDIFLQKRQGASLL